MTTRHSRRRRLVAVAIAMAVIAGACSGDDDDEAVAPTTTPDDGSAASPQRVSVQPSPEQAGDVLGLRLSEGSAIAHHEEAVPQVTGEPLAPDAVAAILARLPDWDVPAEGDQRPFNRPAATLAPPLAGTTVETPFPPAAALADPTPPAGGPLTVVRYQPEGEVEVAPFVTVTFDQPMVAVATLEQLDAADVPATITPAVDGRWRWVGTRTLRFEMEPGVVDRLPAATEYRVEIPAGTRAANGARLADDVTWTFRTPPARVVSFVGESDRLPLTPVFVAVFDQRVDAGAVLPTITARAGSTDVALRLATDAEITADVDADRAVGDALEGRAVAFRPVRPLPVDSRITVTVGPGTPSAEGPLTDTGPKVFTGRTYGAFDVARTHCGDARCVPGMPLVIEMTNELDVKSFAAEQITVRPAIPGLRVDVYGTTIQLQGVTAGSTDYAVTLRGELADAFGQTLGEPRTVQFQVGPAQPVLDGLPRDWITTDPYAEQPTVSIRTINHDSVRVLAWAVTPADVQAFRAYLERTWNDTSPTAPDWPQVLDEVVEIDAPADRFVETAIDLSDAFAAAGTQVVVRVEPVESYAADENLYWQNRPTVAWVQATTLGIAAIHDGDEMVIWTTDLVSGEPVGNVAVELLGDGRVARTNSAGLAEVPLADLEITGVFGNAGDRTAFLPFDWYGGVTATATASAEGRWYVFDDRGIYKPGETARLTGWVRRIAWSDDAQIGLYGDGLQVRYDAFDAQGAEIGSGTVPVNALGGFDLAIELPAGANLGQAWVNLTLIGVADDEQASTGHAFQVQEFRPPEFEVTARQESSGPFFVDEPATVAVDARYYAGGPLGDAEVTWLVTTQETTYEPPNWDEYQFGVWRPWWYGAGDVRGGIPTVPCIDCPPGGGPQYAEYSGRTDPGGTHYMEIELGGRTEPGGTVVDLPRTVTAEATVFDLNRQAWASRTDLVVHPSEVYVGARSDRAFVEEDTPIRYDLVVTDVDGQPVAGRRVDVTAGRVEWRVVGGEWTEQIVDAQTCVVTSTSDPTSDPTDAAMRCEFAAEIPGEYRITAVVTDSSGRPNRTQTTTWVAGAGSGPVRNLEQERITIVPDRETYAVGDTAQLLVQAPFDAAAGLVTTIHHGIVGSEAFTPDGGSAVVEIPIGEAAVPEITVQIDMVGTAPRFADDGTPLPDTPPRPAFATGQITLAVPPLTRALTVDARPADDELRPGEDTTVAVEVRGADGEPVADAEVAVVVVDEAVLALTGYQLTDPLEVFYGPLYSSVTSRDTRSSVLLTRDDLLASGRDTGTDDAAEDTADGAGAPTTTVPGAEADRAAADAAEPIDVRENFEPLAVFAPGRRTGPDGTVTVDVPLPDTLTRYRVMAVAVDGADRFGKGESTISARLPLMIRPSAPRFLNYGDRFELPIVVQNQTGAPMDVSVAVQAANLIVEDGTAGAAGKLVSVPANDRIEVRFPMRADQAGTARVRIAGVGGDDSDASEIDLPVYTPATAEAFATYGVIDEPGQAVGQPLVPPAGVIADFGGLEINTSTTALQALTDAVIYLEDYPYRTPDGYASRILAVASLRDVLHAFDAEGLPSRSELDQRMASDIASLVAQQNDDGGWSWWARGLPSVPWQTLNAAHALAVARDADYRVPAGAFDRALAFLRDIDQHIPADYPADVRTTLRAYAVHVRALAGDRDPARATALYRDGGISLQLDAIAMLWPAIDDPEIRAEIERLFLNAATETAGAATFATSYSEAAYVIAVSDRRTDGIVLDALISEAPDSDLIPKVVAGLLGHQTRGRWNSAQDNAFILVAMKHYFDRFEGVAPDLVARAWLGDTYVFEQGFRQRTTDRATTVVPMSEVIGVAPDTSLVLQKDGEGRLYYRLGLRYAPENLMLAPRDEGFVVERVYEPIEEPADVRRDADGTWRIRAGAPVRVTVTMVADARRTHVALVDPLPAGLEPVNPAFAVSQTFAPEPTDDGELRPLEDAWCSCWQWFEHQNLRDDRAEAFASHLDGGTYEYTYIARATTPGEFVVPPARAEELFAPEVFGRSATVTVVIS